MQLKKSLCRLPVFSSFYAAQTFSYVYFLHWPNGVEILLRTTLGPGIFFVITPSIGIFFRILKNIAKHKKIH